MTTTKTLKKTMYLYLSTFTVMLVAVIVCYFSGIRWNSLPGNLIYSIGYGFPFISLLMLNKQLRDKELAVALRAGFIALALVLIVVSSAFVFA